MIKQTLSLTLIALALFLLNAPAMASQDINFEKIESTGLYTKEREGSLGSDLWKNTPRSALVKLLEALPANSKDPVLRKLIYGLLLTRARASEIDNDIEIEAGYDLLTLRLNKLLEGGFYSQAQELYTKAEPTLYHENLARAGILSLLFTGERSLACLEVNVAKENLTESESATPFIDNLKAYCDIILSETIDEDTLNSIKDSDWPLLKTLAQDRTFSFSYTPESFAALSPLEQALLIAEGRLKVGKFEISDIDKIPPAHIPFLLNTTKLSAKDQLLITIKALDWGFKTSKDLKALYVQNSADLTKETTSPAVNDEESTSQEEKLLLDTDLSTTSNKTSSTPLKLKEWEKLPYHFAQAVNAAKGQEQWEAIRKAFSLQKQYGINALAPFSDLLSQTKPHELTPEDLHTALTILWHNEEKIPAHWIKITQEQAAQAPEDPKLFTLLSAIKLASTNKPLSHSESQKLKERYTGKKNLKTIFPTFIIENLDKPYSNVNNTGRIYDKDFDLTTRTDYVMHTVYVWDRLYKARQDNNIGETILLSTIVLHDTPLKDAYPGFGRDVLNSLNQVGLTNISRELAISALLGNIK